MVHAKPRGPSIPGKPDDIDDTLYTTLLYIILLLYTSVHTVIVVIEQALDTTGKVINNRRNCSTSCSYDYVNVFDNTSTDRSFAAQKSGCQIAILYSEVHFEAG